MAYVAERPYSKILCDSIMRTSNPDFTEFVEKFRAFRIHQPVGDLVIDESVDFTMPPLFRALASDHSRREDPIYLSTGKYQSGVAMLVYAINFNGPINNIKVDLSRCDLTDAEKPLQCLSHLNKHIKSMNLSGNCFTINEICFLFQNLWDKAAAPTFDTIDCQSNAIDITLEDIQYATTKRPECTYVLITMKKAPVPAPVLAIHQPKYRGTFIISTEGKAAVYEICNGCILSKDGVPVPKDPAPVMAVAPRFSEPVPLFGSAVSSGSDGSYELPPVRRAPSATSGGSSANEATPLRVAALLPGSAPSTKPTGFCCCLM